MKFWRIILLTGFFLLAACSQSSVPTGSPTQASAYIQNKGSDTMVNLALAWAERYQSEHPDVSLSVTGGGSGTGIAALVNGTVDIANASRQITDQEKAEAKKNGYDAIEYVVARDAIAVIVNPTSVRVLVLGWTSTRKQDPSLRSG